MNANIRRSFLKLGGALFGGSTFAVWSAAASSGNGAAVLKKEYPYSAYAWREANQFNALNNSIISFFGSTQGEYLFPTDIRESGDDVPSNRMLIANQFERMFSGPTHPEITLQSGYRVLGCSYPRDALAKAFILTVGNSVQIRAAAVLHYHQGKSILDSAAALRAVGRLPEKLGALLRAQRVDLKQASKQLKASPALTVFFDRRSGEDRLLARELALHVRSILVEENRGAHPLTKIRRFKLLTQTV